MPSASSLPSRVIRATVTNVQDDHREGISPNVYVYVRPERAADDSDPIAVNFQAEGDGADVGLAERARKLEVGAKVVIEFTTIATEEGQQDINLGRGLSGG